ncbi:helix-turn-helix domain-containing protein [Streptomyces sp. 8L]|uniref:helix-turn-helix domain-containing protein n=1 Tax=Streptomyces sp. 8L TaxID=2877242 RepID=UPI0035A99766
MVGGVEGLVDAPRSGAPRKITDEQVESLVARTPDQAPPSGDSHWSTRTMPRLRACRSRLVAVRAPVCPAPVQVMSHVAVAVTE